MILMKLRERMQGKFSKFLGFKSIYILLFIVLTYLLVIIFVVVPTQGGTTFSSELIPTNGTAYEEILPLQEFLGKQGRSVIIATVMLSHVLFANLHLGGSWVASATESLYIKTKKERYNRLAKSITLFNVMLFSAGATFAIAGVLAFVSLYPTFASNLFHIYWWPLLAEAIAFALEILFLYTYWFTWGKIKNGWHQFLGYSYAVAVFIQTLLINMVASGMLTPGAEAITWGSAGALTMPFSEFMSWWFNATTWRLQFHRIFAAISYTGFLVAMLAMFHFQDRKEESARKYWDWVGSYGVSWGLVGLIMQPIFGLIYMLAIFDAEENAFLMIMHGPRAWEMLLMVTLLSTLFLVLILYFINRRERILSQHENQFLSKLFKGFLVVAAICAVILVQPAWFGANSIDDPGAIENPLGIMDLKYPALLILVLIGTALLMLDWIMLSDMKESEWGELSVTSRVCLTITGLLGMFIVVVMGFVRESARSPWVIYNIIPIPESMTHPTPVSLGRIMGVWLIITLIILAIFWFTSKVTAHHPEKAETI